MASVQSSSIYGSNQTSSTSVEDLYDFFKDATENMKEIVDSLIEKTLDQFEMRKKVIFRPSFPQQYENVIKTHDVMIALKQKEIQNSQKHSFLLSPMIVLLAILVLVALLRMYLSRRNLKNTPNAFLEDYSRQSALIEILSQDSSTLVSDQSV